MVGFFTKKKGELIAVLTKATEGSCNKNLARYKTTKSAKQKIVMTFIFYLRFKENLSINERIIINIYIINT